MNSLYKFFQRKTSSVSPESDFRELGNILPNTGVTEMEDFNNRKYSKSEVHPQIDNSPSLPRIFSRDCISIMVEESSQMR